MNLTVICCCFCSDITYEMELSTAQWPADIAKVQNSALFSSGAGIKRFTRVVTDTPPISHYDRNTMFRGNF